MMNGIKPLHLCCYLVTLLLLIIDVTYGYCSTAQTSGACTESQCIFNTVCGCSLDFKQDVIFIIDGTNALSATDFGRVKTFLNQTIRHALPSSSTNTRIGLYQYTTSTSPSYVAYQTLTNSTTQSQTLNIINQMTSQQASSTSADSSSVLTAAINSFNSASTDNQRRIMVLITAEASTIEVCSKAPRQADITTYVITIGSNWLTKRYHCLTTARDKGVSFIELTSSSGLTTTSILNKMEDLMCPTQAVVKITEVKSQTTGSPRFVELKNYGPRIALANTSLKLEGFWPNAFFGTGLWTQGQYLVVYDGDGGAVVDAGDCTCSKTAGMCTTATTRYFGCCSSCTITSPATRIQTCGTFSATVTQLSWTLTVSVGGVKVDNATCQSDTSWPKPNAKYSNRSYELVYPILAPGWGSSWTLSCNQRGTPGCGHTSCSCVDDSCSMNSGGISCDSGTCDCLDGYFPNELACDKFPLVSTCTALVKASPSTDTVDYLWELPNWDRQHQYKVQHCSTNPTVCTNAVTAFGVVRTQTGVDVSLVHPGSVAVSWQPDTSFQSEYFNCTRATIAPTSQPTKAPTFHRPNITSCNYTLNQARSQYIAKWSYPVGQDMGSLGNPTEYRIYENGDIKSTTQTRTATLTVSNFDISTTTVQVEAYWSGTPSYVSFRKICTNFTQAPTRTPTKRPTKRPTTPPTKLPTLRPTASPVYMKLNTSNCVIEYLAGSSKSAYIHYATPNYNYPQTVSANETTFELSFYCNNTLLDVWSATLAEPVRRPLGVLYNPSRHHACLRPAWTEHQVTQVKGTFVTCAVTTVGPTPAPTHTPSEAPTPVPTWSPTAAPTKRPSAHPTPGPTFEDINITWCDFQLDSGNEYGMVTFLTVDLDYPDTPNSTEVAYSFIFNLSGRTQTYPPIDPLLQSSLHCANGGDITSSCIVQHHLVNELSPTYKFGTDSMKMVVRFIDLFDSGGSTEASVRCAVQSATPTAAPTRSPSKSPTKAPTWGPTQVYFNAPMCDDSLPKKDGTVWGNPANSETRNSERCGCNIWAEDCGLPIPIIVVTESADPTSIVVKRNEPSYVYDIQLTYNLSFVNLELVANTSFNDTLDIYNRIFFENNVNQSVTANIPPDSWFTPDHVESSELGEMGPTKADITNWNGVFNLTGGDSRSSNLLLDIIKELPPDGLLKYSTDLKNEVFLLTLTKCSIVGGQSRHDAQSNDIRNCILSYPTSVFLIVQDGDDRFSQVEYTEDNQGYEAWLWYVLGGIGIFLAVAGFMAYRWWVNNKMKQAEVKQADEDIDAVINEQEGGFGQDLDQVAVNPLAQPFTHLQGPTTKDFNTDDTDADDGMAEKAEVRTEKIKFKQEFGPTQAVKKN